MSAPVPGRDGAGGEQPSAAPLTDAPGAAPTQAGWAEAHNVLCVRLDSLGDVLMCTPAMRAAVQAQPAAARAPERARKLTLLTSPGGAAVAPFVTEIDAVIEYAAPWMKSSAAHPPGVDQALIATLRERAFDAAVIFTSYSQSPLPAALLCHLAGIPLRLAHCRENPYRMLTDWVAEAEPQSLNRHEVQRQLDLVASVGWRCADNGLSFAVRRDDLEWVRQRLSGVGIDLNRPWILLHPGASAPSRRYPAPLWGEVIGQLARAPGCQMILTGGMEEVPLIAAIRAHGGAAAHPLGGQFNLGQLGAAIALATVVVSNNTGPAHIAAALGTPLVELYALTNPQHTPWQVEHRLLFHDVPCRFCLKSVCPQGHHACLAKVEPERVARAVRALLRSR
jgi:lipopolysaccharide heptosyltransferase II